MTIQRLKLPVPSPLDPIPRHEISSFNFLDFIRDYREFTITTFGPGLRTKGHLDHLAKELIEIQKNPTDVEEWIDVMLLAISGVSRAGADEWTIIEALIRKARKNQHRTWPDWRTSDPDKAIEHDRSKDE